jgi:CheY-like chemotaxis protein
MVFNTVRAHGGTLAINSQEGKGTQVVLTFPLLAAEPGPALAVSPLARPGAALRILVVDDDELIRSTVPLMLRVLGHQVEAVDGGRAALDHLSRAALPDLVILDMNMPDMTGKETLRHIRARCPDLPVLLATGFVEPDVEGLVQADPRTLIIGKPFSFDEIQRKFSEVEALGTPRGAEAPQARAELGQDVAARSGPPAPGAAPLPARGAPAVPPTPTEPLSILLIEDNAIDALSIEGLLKKRNLAFRLAN